MAKRRSSLKGAAGAAMIEYPLIIITAVLVFYIAFQYTAIWIGYYYWNAEQEIAYAGGSSRSGLEYDPCRVIGICTIPAPPFEPVPVP